MRGPIVVSLMSFAQELPCREYQQSRLGPSRKGIGYDADGVVGMAAWTAPNGVKRDAVETHAGRFVEQRTPKPFVYVGRLRRQGGDLSVYYCYGLREIGDLVDLLFGRMLVGAESGHLQDEERVLVTPPKVSTDRVGACYDMTDLVERLRRDGAAGPQAGRKRVLLAHDERSVAAVHLESREGEAAPG